MRMTEESVRDEDSKFLDKGMQTSGLGNRITNSGDVLDGSRGDNCAIFQSTPNYLFRHSSDIHHHRTELMLEL